MKLYLLIINVSFILFLFYSHLLLYITLSVIPSHSQFSLTHSKCCCFHCFMMIMWRMLFCVLRSFFFPYSYSCIFMFLVIACQCHIHVCDINISIYLISFHLSIHICILPCSVTHSFLMDKCWRIGLIWVGGCGCVSGD